MSAKASKSVPASEAAVWAIAGLLLLSGVLLRPLGPLAPCTGHGFGAAWSNKDCCAGILR